MPVLTLAAVLVLTFSALVLLLVLGFRGPGLGLLVLLVFYESLVLTITLLPRILLWVAI